MVGAQFWRVRPSKNQSGERRRTAPAKRDDKNHFRRRLRRHFSDSGPVFCRFWAPGRTPKWRKNRPRATRDLFLDHTFSIFLRFVRSGAFWKAPASISEAPGTLPDQILRGFCDTSLLVLSGSCQGLSASAGMWPGSAPDLSNPLAGVPLGYGDTRSGLNNLRELGIRPPSSYNPGDACVNVGSVLKCELLPSRMQIAANRVRRWINVSR